MRRNTGRIDPKGAKEHLVAIGNTAALLWRRACEHDGIAEDSRFAVLSDDNPYTKWLNLAMAELSRTRREYEAGGYVGLKIENGRAA